MGTGCAGAAGAGVGATPGFACGGELGAAGGFPCVAEFGTLALELVEFVPAESASFEFEFVLVKAVFVFGAPDAAGAAIHGGPEGAFSRPGCESCCAAMMAETGVIPEFASGVPGVSIGPAAFVVIGVGGPIVVGGTAVVAAGGGVTAVVAGGVAGAVACGGVAGAGVAGAPAGGGGGAAPGRVLCATAKLAQHSIKIIKDFGVIATPWVKSQNAGALICSLNKSQAREKRQLSGRFRSYSPTFW